MFQTTGINQYNFGNIGCPTPVLPFEGSNAEVGQLIAGTKFVSFLTPCLASKSS